MNRPRSSGFRRFGPDGLRGSACSNSTRFGAGHAARRQGEEINVSEGSGSAPAEERWSASAAAFTAWRSGQADGLEELVRQLSPVLWQVTRATGLDRASAEDVVQNTWLQLVDHAGSIESPVAVAGWLCTTARREAWRVSKQNRRETAVDDDSLGWAMPAVEGPEDGVVL